jgi:hypothetical protein
MSGDYSRWSYDPRRHFAAVLMQQGRVSTDADWNEWATTVLRRVQAASLDTLGRAAVPRETPDGFRIEAAGGKLTVGRGRIYVDGLLVENHGEPPDEWDPRLAEQRGTGATPYDAQPYLPDPPPLPAGGPHLVYVKAWQRELTYIEDPALVEKALGVDATTRLQTAWQVKVLPDVGAAVTCATPLEDVPGFLEAEPPAAGRLTTGSADVQGQPDPCRVPPSGGYKGLENQLYRVEIHAGGDLAGQDRATFKWSRDNGTVASRVSEIPALDRIVVESVGRDALLRFSDGDWVEVTDDRRELAGLPGEMRRIQAGGGVDDATRTIRLTDPLPAGMFPVDGQGRTAPERNTRVRRWDQQGRVLDADGNLVVDLDDPGADGTIPVADAPTQILLEHGVVATFDLDPGSGRFRTGDHWLFAARTADASVEELQDAPRRGIHAHYAGLALVTFPDAETDCRTLWPPEVGDPGCDCTVCVTPESHANGELTIQAAIDQVKETGGTVCLGTGTYALADPVEIHDAGSVRLRGKGWATVLVATGGRPALDVRRGIGIAIEDLAVVASAVEAASDAIRIGRCLDVAVERCYVLGLPVSEEGGAAIGLEGVLVGLRMHDCVLAAHTGIAGGAGGEREEREDREGREDPYLVTASLRLDSNWLWCAERGIELGRSSIHLADTRIAGNTVWGCGEAGLISRGANAVGPFNVEGNAFRVDGSGIVVGVDAARIADNDVQGGGDGIALDPGLDAGGIDHCQVLANRIRGVKGHGIAIRTRVNSGMIKHNVIAETGGGGIVMQGEGSAGRLVVENNQLLDIGQSTNKEGLHASALRFVAVEDLHVAGNAVRRFSSTGRQAASRSAILAVAPGSACIDANRLAGIAPAEGFLGRSSGIEVVRPLRSADVAGNAVARRGGEEEKLAGGTWTGVRVGGPELDGEGRRRPFLALGDLAVADLEGEAVVFTATNALAFAARARSDVALRANAVVAEASDAPPVLVSGAALCQLAENRIRSPESRGDASVIRCARAIVSGNDLRGISDASVLEIDLLLENQPAVLGNLRSGDILVDGNPLGAPWAELNPFSTD